MARLLLWLAAINAVPCLMADIVYSVTGPLIGGGAIGSTQALAVSWTQSSAYADVVISAEVSGATSDLLTAYLTTQIGPGTTVADEVARASIAFPGSSFSDLAILNIPFLPAGTYYLTLAGTGMSGDLAETTMPLQTMDAGVTRNPDYYFSGPPGYPPSGIMLRPPIVGLFVFSVTTTVPEPAAGTVVGGALAGLLLAGILRQRIPLR